MSELIRLELKYCERCGGLLLRRAGLNLNFCQPCQRIERDLPPLRPLPVRRPRPSQTRGVLLPFRPTSVKSPNPLPDIHACHEGDLA